MVVYGENGFERAIHNIENSPFRTKFERDVEQMAGNSGIGCISDTEPQPLIVRSHLGNFAITTVGRINNIDALVKEAFAFSAAFEGDIPGAKKIECGNYLEHDLPAARAEAAAYLDVLAHCTPDTLTYPD